MLKNLNFRIIFWFLFLISIIFIIMVKFSPLKDIHTSQISFISWFPFGFELGETVFDLCIGYIVSCIFYYIVVYLPEQKKRKQTMTIIEKRIDSILGSMGITIYYYFHKYGISENNKRFQEQVEDLETIDCNNKMNFSYQYIEKPTGRTVRMNTGEFTEIMSLLDHSKRIQGTINNIFKIPVIVNIDEDLIVILEEINNCQLFRTVSALKMFPLGITPGFGKDLFLYYLLYKKLSKYIEPTKYNFDQRVTPSD
ncbi:hypothetical protein ACFW35_02420 [Fictibacillus sp. NPDC058756]|uniref:hypothetical protein n=1 Tax=Fictibacillus sp. NPDC058756 TaxID=3346625 RepID=UPI0036C7DC9D